MMIRSIDRLKLTGIMLAVLIAAIACTSATSSNQQDPQASDNSGSPATTVPAANTAGQGNGSTSNGDVVAVEPNTSTGETAAVIEGDAAVEQATGALFLQMISPATDELFVTSSSYEFAGRTTVDALLSVNDSVLEVDEEGRFAFAMNLEEGPNVIEVVASNGLGEQFDEVLLVIYEPA